MAERVGGDWLGYLRHRHSRIAGSLSGPDGFVGHVLMLVSWEVGRWSEGGNLVIPKDRGRIAWEMRIG